jgi:hypothetical protein
MFPGLWTPTGESILSKPWGVDCVALFCMVLTLFFHLQSHLSKYKAEMRKLSQMAERVALLEKDSAPKESKKVTFESDEEKKINMEARLALLEKGLTQIVVAEAKLSSEFAAQLRQKLSTGGHWGQQRKELQERSRSADERAAVYKAAKEALFTGMTQ